MRQPIPSANLFSRCVTFKLMLCLLAGGLLSIACLAGELVGETPAPGGGDPPASDWYTIYFTDPTDPAAGSYRGGPDEALAAAIDDAKASVDVAIYDFNLWSLRDALISAHRRGVVVRMVTESDNMDEAEVQELRQAGIEVIGDRREGLMHNKFVVIDRQEVWTGSMNFNTGSAYLNDNNLLRLRSSRLAEDYRIEFLEMFEADEFGAGSPANTPFPSTTIDGTPVEVYFSPDDGALAHLVELVQGARQSINFMAYSFTSDALANAMLERASQGVSVTGVFEAEQVQSNQGGEYENLRNAGLDVRLDGNSRHMHHKVIIIDGQVVITGSYNFSNNAEERNDENVVILYNAAIAASYLEEFQRVFALGQP